MTDQNNDQQVTNNNKQTADPQLARQKTLQGDSVASDGGNDKVKTLQNIESMINSSLAKMQRIKEDLNPVKEMIDSFLENDEKYNQLVEVSKKAGKAKSARKKDLLTEDGGQELKSKLDTLKEERKDTQEQLSYYLREFQRLTGANEIETDDGELREIKLSAKLVRKTNLNR